MRLSFWRPWRFCSLRAKLLWPIVGLMLISLLGSTLTFLVGTALTQRQLIQQQTNHDIERVTEALMSKVSVVADTATLLANDPQIIAAVQTDCRSNAQQAAGDMDCETALSELNSRAVVVRDRFDLDLIQIYNQQGQARTNLVLSSLYRESSLIDQVTGREPVVRVVAERVLLLSRADMPQGVGAVVAGIDLETELGRLVSFHRLSGDLGLSAEGVQVGTRPDLPFAASEGRQNGQHLQRLSLKLGQTPIDLLLAQPTTEIARLTNTGLWVMVGSTLLTTLLLMGLSVVITRAIAQPVQQLSAAAEVVARGNLGQQAEVANLSSSFFGVGQEDEIGLLAIAFNRMVVELRGLYQNLEAKVQARTRELSIAAQVASAVSSRLDLNAALSASVGLIHQQLGFYFVAIFTIEPDSNAAVLREATGQAGQQFKARRFELALESRSLVGATVLTRQPQVVQDVSAEPRYLCVPELADTRSEVAIPLLSGQTVIGVLDVQSRQPHAFTPEVIQLLLTLANQISSGVHNAQLYTRQRETAEHLAAANARLQELDRIKDEFIQNVSHELRTPLALIRGYAEALETGMLGQLDEEQHHTVSIIARRSRMMTGLVEDITALLEIEAKAGPKSPVRLTDLTREALEDFQALADSRQLQLQAKIETDLPPVMGQEGHLRKVVDNLVNNALKFTPAGGSVAVRLFQRNQHLTLEVSDTGIGIPPEEQERVFERFYQVDGSVKRRYGGSGLGLALVKEVVKAHQGEMTLQSQPGQGSVFTVKLPLSADEGPNNS